MRKAADQKTFHFTVDRSLSVPVGVQLRGQIEYGIACGEIERDARLPSVRELAQDLGIAHVTVAQVYKDLLARGMIVTQPGRGTFVAPAAADTPNFSRIRSMLTDVLDRAARDGITPEQVAELLGTLLARDAGTPPLGVKVVIIGLFDEVTRAYAEDLQATLQPGDRVRAVTLDQLHDRTVRQEVREADVVLSLAHRVSEARSLLPGVEIIPVGFIPAPTTRSTLAALDPRVRLTVVATFEEFLPTFTAGVHRFAPHVSEVHATHIHAEDLPQHLEWADVVVYASGSERVTQLVPNGKQAFEYRHTIDPRDVERLVLPAVHDHRTTLDQRNDS